MLSFHVLLQFVILFVLKGKKNQVPFKNMEVTCTFVMVTSSGSAYLCAPPYISHPNIF